MKTDSQLKRDAQNELRWDCSINDANIEVIVQSRVVTVTGQVTTFAEKCAAEEAARRVQGVKGIINKIEVNLPGKLRRTDKDIVLSCSCAIRGKYLIPRDAIRIDVCNGWVTLDGELEWNFQKEAAAGAVQELMGVRGLTNRIGIVRRPTTTGIKRKIVAAISRSSGIDARRIQVETQNGTVILSGTVRSRAQREQAQQAAWAAPGVSAVDNRLAVVP